MKNIKAKIALLILAVMFILPVLSVGAESDESWNIKTAADRIVDNDPSLDISTSKPFVSQESRVFEIMWVNDLRSLQNNQAYYADRQKEYQAEMTAYELLYNYWFLKESLKVSQEAVNKAGEELDIIRLKNEQGLASVRNVLEAELRLNSAKASYQDTLAASNNLKFQVNLKLTESNIGKEILLDEPELELINKPDPEDLAEDMKDSHETISSLEMAVDTFEDILKTIDGLEGSVLGDVYKDEVSKAKVELRSYYREEKEEAEAQITQQKQALELLSYSLAEQFNQVETKINLYKANLKNTEMLYEQAKKSYEVGMSDNVTLEQARIGVSQSKLQLLGAKKDYLILKEKLRLFKKGYMPRG